MPRQPNLANNARKRPQLATRSTLAVLARLERDRVVLQCKSRLATENRRDRTVPENQRAHPFRYRTGFFYALQYTESLTNGQPGPFWTNLYVAPKLLDPNHYVVPDTGTRAQRFYRLRVYP